MSMSDPIADMLTRIRNAQMVEKKEVNVPASNLKSAIASVMQEEGYIKSFSVDGIAASKTLNIKLKYYDNKSVIEKLKRISKPSLRVYVSSSQMPSVMNGLGIVIVSTPKGVMTGQTAYEQNIGGEVLCSVY
ncbi:SSU ribosomal protein S8P [Candidatus Ruthia magnifica str. Cm (Calyptogena magnifica)]|uniref:Small ribosomal subunit protein uS8 n=1 Tax=Ruthia magnifica subsp. Calyptogena magnifica TaxID=413404 RepID=RS8_RUTMC|nr:30S ribosomal protein S8 [Candidatus Ruthturnera calyptogenae]A1AVL4.1 RecName: Full=Small ribosomal subunit protein uS8; AltName: Full=30S ribosomal protein S8 [Candidatus Ruthia magnifica str. Cm (Calyptogena magnifica)]ABL01971.1 SSU ribosomal protein S8P [Candidatus Ruthia magnifica str. Cm (Calyptogena magnifica)]